MDRLVIQVRPPSRAGALEAHLDRRSNILSLTSPVAAEWPFGLDLSARVLMDFTADWQLANLDLLIPPSRWQHGGLELPQTRQAGSLALNAMPMQRNSYALAVEALSPSDSELHLHWGPGTASHCLILSDQVMALLSGSLWVGLQIQGF